MRWPRLVPRWARKTPVTLYFTNGETPEGAPNVVKTVETLCSYREQGTPVLDAERRYVRGGSVVLLDGDPAPELAQLEGEACVAGGAVRRRIALAKRGRNPDGTVNYTELELM